jgi:hypothetical protein
MRGERGFKASVNLFGTILNGTELAWCLIAHTDVSRHVMSMTVGKTVCACEYGCLMDPVLLSLQSRLVVQPMTSFNGM